MKITLLFARENCSNSPTFIIIQLFKNIFSVCAVVLAGGGLSPESRYPVYLGSLLDDQHWHHVTVERHSDHLNLTVDQATMWVQIPARFTHWDHDQVCFCQCVGCKDQKNTRLHSHLLMFVCFCTAECGSRS